MKVRKNIIYLRRLRWFINNEFGYFRLGIPSFLGYCS